MQNEMSYTSYQEVYVHDIYRSVEVCYMPGDTCTLANKKNLHRDDKLLRPNMDLWPDMRVICIVFAYVPSGLRSGHLL